MKPLNCWEYKKCGREWGGSKVHELGICPAVKETKLNGLHHGNNAGRSCWIVAGTFCGGTVTGTFAEKISTCESCDFYNLVKDEYRSDIFKIKGHERPPIIEIPEYRAKFNLS